MGPRLGGAAAQFLARGLVKPEEHGRFEAGGRASAPAPGLGRARGRGARARLCRQLPRSGSRSRPGLDLGPAGDPERPAPHARRDLEHLRAIPLYQFLVYRTLVRLLSWSRFLWAVSRLDLQLVPTHPDRAGGLGFLGGAHRPLGLLAVALGAGALGPLLHRDPLRGRLAGVQAPVAVFVVMMLLVCLGPLVVFTPRLMAARRKGSSSTARWRCATRRFRPQVAAGRRAAGRRAAGHRRHPVARRHGRQLRAIEQMRPVPFSLKDVTSLVAACLFPIDPGARDRDADGGGPKTVMKILG